MIDLSSDTATRPTPAMRRFMCHAEVGDEQRLEDPTVRALEEHVAELLGKEAALFVPSGTLCNILAYFVHCSPGDEVVLHRETHTVYSENGGPAVHSRVSIRTLEGPRGQFTADQVEEAIQPCGFQKPRTRLVSVENTSNRGGGSVWPIEQLRDVCAAARRNGLAVHLDGARLLNAVVATGVPASRWCAGFDSAWIDLSKALGCPMGAVLAGSRAFVDEARWAKHLFGGALRQAGIVAAAGIYALRHHVERLADDHELAAELARGLAGIAGVGVDAPETNIVHFEVDRPADVLARTESAGVRFSAVAGRRLRAVTHLDIHAEHVPLAVAAVAAAVAPCSA